MPVLAALDETLNALAKISKYAADALSQPETMNSALVKIQMCCDDIDETIQGILQSLDDEATS